MPDRDLNGGDCDTRPESPSGCPGFVMSLSEKSADIFEFPLDRIVSILPVCLVFTSRVRPTGAGWGPSPSLVSRFWCIYFYNFLPTGVSIVLTISRRIKRVVNFERGCPPIFVIIIWKSTFSRWEVTRVVPFLFQGFAVSIDTVIIWEKKFGRHFFQIHPCYHMYVNSSLKTTFHLIHAYNVIVSVFYIQHHWFILVLFARYIFLELGTKNMSK